MLLKKRIHIFHAASSAKNSQIFYSACGNEKNVTSSLRWVMRGGFLPTLSVGGQGESKRCLERSSGDQ